MSRRAADDRRESEERPDREAPRDGRDIAVPRNAAVAADVLSGDPIPEPDGESCERFP
jgi:hypothetical protein